MRAVATAALLACASIVAGCASSPHDLRTHHARRSSPATHSADDEVGRRALRTVELLRSAPPLTAADRELLRRAVPSALPFIPAATAAVTGRGLSGRYWVAAGVVGAERAPGLCLYVRSAGADTVGAGCFDYETVDAGRAVQLFTTATGDDVIGIVPDDVHVVEVGDNAGHKTRLRARQNVYAGTVSFRPRAIRVHHMNHLVELRLSD